MRVKKINITAEISATYYLKAYDCKFIDNISEQRYSHHLLKDNSYYIIIKSFVLQF